MDRKSTSSLARREWVSLGSLEIFEEVLRVATFGVSIAVWLLVFVSFPLFSFAESTSRSFLRVIFGSGISVQSSFQSCSRYVVSG